MNHQQKVKIATLGANPDERKRKIDGKRNIFRVPLFQTEFWLERKQRIADRVIKKNGMIRCKNCGRATRQETFCSDICKEENKKMVKMFNKAMKPKSKGKMEVKEVKE